MREHRYRAFDKEDSTMHYGGFCIHASAGQLE